MHDAQRLLLTRRYQTATALIGDRAATLTAHHWKAVGHDEANIPEFAHRAAPAFNAAKTAAVQLSSGYYSLLTGRRPVGVNPRDVLIDPDVRAPFIAYWNALKGGAGDDAVLSGIARAEAIARNFAVSSGRRTGDVVMHRQGLRPGDWTRITDGGACAWCEEVAAQTYSSAEAADFGHDRCGCTAVPNIE